jgi:hypothetical protein
MKGATERATEMRDRARREGFAIVSTALPEDRHRRNRPGQPLRLFLCGDASD